MKNIYLITGTSKGLGKALVNELKENNENKIFCIQRTSEKEKIENGTIVEFDLRNADNAENLMNAIFDEMDLSKVDQITLINNAGVLSPITSIHNARIEEISDNIDVNLKALIVLTSIFLKKTEKVNIKKIVINISSGAGNKPYDGWSVYCATKAGVDLFTRCVALEQKRQEYPATIFSFYPSIIDTRMQELIRNSDKEDFPLVEKFIGYQKNNDLLSPDFVAKTLIKFANGESIENGGIYDIENMM